MTESQSDMKTGNGDKVIDAEVEPLANMRPRRIARVAAYLGFLVIASIVIAVLYHLWSTDRLDGIVAGNRSAAPASSTSSVTLPVAPPQAAVPPLAPPMAPAAEPSAPAQRADEAPRADPRIGELEQRLASLTASLERLQQLPASNGADPQKLAELEARLKSAEAERTEQEQKIALLIQTMEAQGSQRGSVQQQVAGLQQQLGELQSRLAGVAQQSAAALREPVTQLIAWSELRERARRGERFTSEAAMVAPYAERQGGALQQAAGAWQGFAERTPPSLMLLSQRFAPLMQQQLARPAEPAADPAERTWWQRALDRVTGLVSIRRVGAAAAAAPETKLADAETLLAAGDARGAVAALEGVELDADFAAWREQMKARLALDAALDAYGAALRAHLAAMQ